MRPLVALAKLLTLILPFCRMVNLLNPEEEAVKMSPLPLLSTTRPAKLVLAEKEAIGRVLELPRTSSSAATVVVPTPTLPCATLELLIPRYTLPITGVPELAMELPPAR